MSRPSPDVETRLSATLDTFVERTPGTGFDHRGQHELYNRFALAFERLDEVRGKRGLEIGCGSGPYLAEALRRGAAHVVGLDPAPGMLELAHARVAGLGKLDQATFVEGYFPEVVPAGTFDFAIIVGVLDYVTDTPSFLNALRAILAGPAVASFPSRHWFYTPLRRFRYRMRSCAVHFFDEAQIRMLAREARFGTVDVVKIEGAAADYLAYLVP